LPNQILKSCHLGDQIRVEVVAAQCVPEGCVVGAGELSVENVERLYGDGEGGCVGAGACVGEEDRGWEKVET